MGTRRINGAAIRVIRELKGIKHGELAGLANISAGYLTHIEKGERTGSPATALAIANALGVPLTAITYPVEVLNVAEEVAA